MLRGSLRLLYDSYAAHSRELAGVVAAAATAASMPHQANHGVAERQIRHYILRQGALRRHRGAASSRPTQLGNDDAVALSRVFDRVFREVTRAASFPLMLAVLRVLANSATEWMDGGLRRPHERWFLAARSMASGSDEVRAVQMLERMVMAKFGDSGAQGIAAAADDGQHRYDAIAVLPEAQKALERQSPRDISRVLPNDSFVRYFLKQRIVPSEEALLGLVSAMKQRPLSVTRVHTAAPLGGLADARLVAISDGLDAVVQRLQWAPDGVAAYTTADQPATVSSPSQHRLADARQAVHALLEHKLCSVQSASSLLPVMALDPQPGDVVFDVCAAPGSKTSQLLDALSTVPGGPLHNTRRMWSGCILANDGSLDRALKLSDRVGGTDIRLLVVSCQGHRLPGVAGGGGAGGSSDMLADRVLVDAPCSGEGQMHRHPVEWRLWHPQRGVAHHTDQVALLRRAIALTKPGGIVVYSTCTLNPIENEAVAAAVVAEGLVTPVPLPRGAPFDSRALGFHRGLTKWRVPNSAGGFYSDGEGDGDAASTSTTGTMFPSYSSDAVRRQVSDCCRRVVPTASGDHGNNNAAPVMEAFFVIALQRTHVPVADRSTASPSEAEHSDTSSGASRLSNKTQNAWQAGRPLIDTCPSTLQLVPPSSARLDVLLPFFRHFGTNTDLALSLAQQQLGIRFLVGGRRAGRGRVGEVFVASESAARYAADACVSNSNDVLLACGARVVDAAGRLTEVGAHVLVTQLGCSLFQTFDMPLRDALMMLAGSQGITLPLVGAAASGADPFASAAAALRNRMPMRDGIDPPPGQNWLQQFGEMSSDGSRTPLVGCGNAVAQISTGHTATPQRRSHATPSRWCCPVLVTRCVVGGVPSVTLQANLAPAARRRATTMLATSNVGRQGLGALALPRAGARPRARDRQSLGAPTYGGRSTVPVAGTAQSASVRVSDDTVDL